MNVLFLTMVKTNIAEKGIYSDLVRRFRDEGHNVYIVMPCERREGKPTRLEIENGDDDKEGDCFTLSVRTLNVKKTNVIEKGIGQVSLEFLYMRAFKKYFRDVEFDLILYSTPPITITKVIQYAKKLNPQAATYLMLKDIFPQNAVDLGMLATNGLRGFLYRGFRKKEEELYRLSDWIGCMSPANVQYVLDHNQEVDTAKVEICANSFEPDVYNEMQESERRSVRRRFNLPIDKPIFFYGGNLGKPQGIPFLIKCLEANRERTDCHFLVVGDGFDYRLLKNWYNTQHPRNMTLMQRLPIEDYNRLANACDVGLIFLDYRFTIPNYPSRLLSYLMQKKPIIACTDTNCDTGTLAEANGYGFWCPSNDENAFVNVLNTMLKSDLKAMGEKGYRFFMDNYTVQHTYNAIMKHFGKEGSV